MLVATPLSTGYDAHAVVRHMNSNTAPAAATTNSMLNRSSEEELVEDDNAVYSQCVPKGTVFGGYGKSSGKANNSRNATVPQLSSAEGYRHCPLGNPDRHKSPEPIISYAAGIAKPIAYDPCVLNTFTSDRADQTAQIIPPPSPSPTAFSTGESRTHIGDSPPGNDSDRDQHFYHKWREVFCTCAGDRLSEVIEKAKDELQKRTTNIEEAAAEREYLIRNQAHLDKQALLGQAQSLCTAVTKIRKRSSSSCPTSRTDVGSASTGLCQAGGKQLNASSRRLFATKSVGNRCTIRRSHQSG